MTATAGNTSDSSSSTTESHETDLLGKREGEVETPDQPPCSGFRRVILAIFAARPGAQLSMGGSEHRSGAFP
jgi:hypothetical protein